MTSPGPDKVVLIALTYGESQFVKRAMREIRDTDPGPNSRIAQNVLEMLARPILVPARPGWKKVA